MKAPDHHLRSTRGEMQVWLPSAALCVTRVIGHLETVVATELLSILSPRLPRARDGLVAFHDWEEMANYDAGARQAMTSWTVAYRRRLREVHLLVQSRVVELGVEVANLALGGIMQTYRDRPAFLAALDGAAAAERVTSPLRA